MLSALTAGLAEVHELGLLHRDIKPANVMLRAKDSTPVLIDFGSARQQSGAISRSLTAVLTPGYAPIEQYSTQGNQGPWTDIYALGAVAYRALSGQTPVDATERVRRDTLPELKELTPEPISAALAEAVGRAMNVDEADRPADLDTWAHPSGEEAGKTQAAAKAGDKTLAAEGQAVCDGWRRGGRGRCLRPAAYQLHRHDAGRKGGRDRRGPESGSSNSATHRERTAGCRV